MVKQDQNHSLNHPPKKKSDEDLHEFYKEKESNKSKRKKEHGIFQGTESQDEKRKTLTKEKHPNEDFDRNEGEGRSQKS